MTKRADTHNPALAPEEAAQEPKTYLVTGVTEVDGHQPGDEFEAIMTPEREASLTEFGHLRIQDTKGRDPKEEKSTEDGETPDESNDGKDD